VPTTSSPSGTRGHTVEVTCYFPDGSTDIIDNGEYAIASIGGMFGIGALIGLVIIIPLMLLPFIFIRKKKEE
jgi:TRAP-type C4-dicarboxylate transport system permease large subunit